MTTTPNPEPSPLTDADLVAALANAEDASWWYGDPNDELLAALAAVPRLVAEVRRLESYCAEILRVADTGVKAAQVPSPESNRLASIASLIRIAFKDR